MRIRTSVFLCVVSRPNFGCFLACSPPPTIKSTHFCIQQNCKLNELWFKKIEYYPNNSNHTCSCDKNVY